MLEQLPQDLLFFIFLFLELKDAFALMSASSTLRLMVSSDAGIWKRLVQVSYSLIQLVILYLGGSFFFFFFGMVPDQRVKQKNKLRETGPMLQISKIGGKSCVFDVLKLRGTGSTETQVPLSFWPKLQERDFSQIVEEELFRLFRA